MGLECAIQSLYKIVSAEEFTEKRNSWSFWASPSELESIQDHEIEKQTFFTDSVVAATNLVSKQGPCWSQLKFSGMMQWGQKRQVRFLGRHEEQNFESLSKETRASVELIEGANEKRKIVEEEEEEEETEAEKAVPFGVLRMIRQCKRSHQNVSSSSGLQKSKIVTNDPKKQQLVVHNNKKRKVSIDRWSAERKIWILGTIVTILLSLSRGRWGSLLQLKDKIGTTIGEAKEIADIVEEVSEKVDKVVEEAEKELPEGIPINKSLYTISYMLLTSATSGLTFIALYVLVDVYGHRRLTSVLEWMGKHAMSIFVLVSSNLAVIAIQGFYWTKPENNIEVQ
ncbi:unnamed protein product [Lupinus luteus]|uniref:Uncharacterized protein n=1 Tax=Lupinus luteus TaxID=3873 RepID=A0AAV1X5S9_LUPLU